MNNYLFQYLKAHPLISMGVWLFVVMVANCVFAGVVGFPWSLLIGVPFVFLSLWKWPFPDSYQGSKHRRN